MEAADDRKHVLVVDDNRDYSENLAEILAAEGFAAQACQSAQEALDLVRQAKVHIAIVDVLLPDMGGLELLARLRQGDPRIGVIMVTGQVSVETAVLALNQGAFGYALKYCDPEEILAYVRRAVEHQEAVERADFSRSLFRTIFERSSDGICVLDRLATRRVLDLNLPFARILGLPQEEIVGRTLDELGPAGSPRSLAAVIEPLRRDRPALLEDVKVELPGGRLRNLELRLGLLKADREGPVQLLARDITEHKRMRERIAHAEKLALLGEFTSRVAHEVRNPLAGIKGALEVLRMKQEDPGGERVIQTIFNRIDQLDLFIRDLLQFARPARPEPRQLPASELLPSVLNLTRTDPLFREVKIEVDPDQGAEIYADPGTLQVVLTNLLRNAAAAMESRGSIHIRLEIRDNDAHLFVEDTGPGFAGDDPEVHFAPFTTTRPDGTGLGLAIARNLVEAHGGSLTASNLPSGGGSLEIVLPGSPGGEEA